MTTAIPVVVGIVSGLLPAIRTARMDPIESLPYACFESSDRAIWATGASVYRAHGTMHAGMQSLAEVFRVLNEMHAAGVVDDYALGGATAVLFYAEPTRTYDLDVFVKVRNSDVGFAPLSDVYEWARARGFALLAEHVLVHGVPVQFLPAYNTLVEEAVAQARELEYEGVKIPVVGWRASSRAGVAAPRGGSGRSSETARALKPWERPWPVEP